MQRIKKKKTVKLDATFLPKNKRVLNKRALRVLHKRDSKVKRPRPQLDVLDSQCSIASCFWDSQGCGPAHGPPSPTLSPPVALSPFSSPLKGKPCKAVHSLHACIRTWAAWLLCTRLPQSCMQSKWKKCCRWLRL